ncbi:TraX family protein (plasmid) [Oscillibacter valericigenes Sjm18-20]|nr:TraX family protein [Oscillibacter valericigenes Sjm18-20]
MVKLLAAVFMLVDHIGLLFFPQCFWLRCIGRLSFPLFAYCIARGYYHSACKGKEIQYARNLFLFALASQVPYSLMEWFSGGSLLKLNIGFTWLLSVVLLKFVCSRQNPPLSTLYCGLVFLLSLSIPIDYGIYGVIFPLMLFWCYFSKHKSYYAFTGMAALLPVYMMQIGGLIQAFSLAAYPALSLGLRYDAKIGRHKRFFYWFYPCHIAALVMLKGILLWL